RGPRRTAMNSIHKRLLPPAAATRLGLVCLMLAGAVAAQQPEMPAMQHEHPQTAKVRALEFPHLGRAQQAKGGALFLLDRALETARQHNPTLRQAEAGIRAARGRTLQEGLYPNPTVGYAGDEIRGGQSGGGKQGLFVEQTLVTGGKLSRAREVFREETRLAEM